MTKKQKKATKALIGIESVTSYSVKRQEDELVYFLIKPINISVLSEGSVAYKIQSLTNVLQSMTELEIVCLRSKENFDTNKEFIQGRIAEEENPVLRKLLELDAQNLDKMQVQMATAREFMLVIRLKGEKDSDVFPYLSRMERSIKDQGFTVKRATKADYMRILSVYFEQNVTSDGFDDFDGERWINEATEC